MKRGERAQEKYAHAGFKLTEADDPLLDKLSAPFKEVLVLSKGMTTGAIAIALGVAPGTAKSRVNRARTALVSLRAQVKP